MPVEAIGTGRSLPTGGCWAVRPAARGAPS